LKRIKLVVAYDGTNYHGWQFQPEQPTIEGILNWALFDLLNEDTEVIGASRTDTGVHAMGNVCVFDTESRIPAEKFAAALNARLPEDIRIMSSSETPLDFHPRYDCHDKTYEYRITRAKIMPPVKRLYSHHIYYHLDVSKMRQAAAYLVGRHDFASFCSAGSSVKDTVRTVLSVDVIEEDADIVIRVKGEGFLYNMVRIIAGTLIHVGSGRMKPEAVRDAVLGTDRSLAGPTAPAKGLTLIEINYDGVDENSTE